MTQKNIEKIGVIFPNVITEMREEDGKLKKSINFELLKQELFGEVIEGEECYNFTWVGKKASIIESNTPIRKTLRPSITESKNWESTKNLYIEGDNIDVLKLLRESYLSSIKMIYIDPPYNTGTDSFVYPDNFIMEKDEYEEQIDYRDEDGNINFLINNETNPKFHSLWCSMMYSRIKIAYNLLTEDGAIYISIDDNEIDNLKKICNEIFGENNFVNTISLNAKVSAGASGGGEDRKLKKNIEYILIYCKNYAEWNPISPVYKETELIDYIEKMKNDNKSFKYTNVLYRCDEVDYFTTIKAGDGDDILIKKVNNYEIKTIKQIASLENISEKEVYYKYFDKIMTTTNAQTSIRDRVWEATDSENNLYIASYTPKSGKNKGKIVDLYLMGKQKVLVIWLKDTAVNIGGVLYKREKIGTYWDGFSWINVTKEGNLKFENGKKPTDLIKRMIELLPQNEDITVMDFFSGSATTAHAVMKLNSEDGGKRKFIMVQYPENINPNSKSNKDYLEYLKNENVLPLITEIGKERIRRAGEKISSEIGESNAQIKIGEECKKAPDIGFRVLKVDSTNMKDVYYAASEYSQGILAGLESNIKDDRTDLDLLYGVLLDWGLPLSLSHKIEEIDGVSVHTVDDGSLIACFADKVQESVVRKIAKRLPLRVVFRDSSFVNSPDKINVEEIFKLHAPNTTVKVI